LNETNIVFNKPLNRYGNLIFPNGIVANAASDPFIKKSFDNTIDLLFQGYDKNDEPKIIYNFKPNKIHNEKISYYF